VLSGEGDAKKKWMISTFEIAILYKGKGERINKQTHVEPVELDPEVELLLLSLATSISLDSAKSAFNSALYDVIRYCMTSTFLDSPFVPSPAA
jgi:hypothetical protein